MAGKRKAKVDDETITTEEAAGMALAAARSVVPELPLADLTGYQRPKEATGELRLRRGWAHMILVIDERGRQFKLYRKPEPVKAAKAAKEPEPVVEPPPGEEPQDQE